MEQQLGIGWLLQVLKEAAVLGPAANPAPAAAHPPTHCVAPLPPQTPLAPPQATFPVPRVLSSREATPLRLAPQAEAPMAPAGLSGVAPNRKRSWAHCQEAACPLPESNSRHWQQGARLGGVAPLKTALAFREDAALTGGTSDAMPSLQPSVALSPGSKGSLGYPELAAGGWMQSFVPAPEEASPAPPAVHLPLTLEPSGPCGTPHHWSGRGGLQQKLNMASLPSAQEGHTSTGQWQRQCQDQKALVLPNPLNQQAQEAALSFVVKLQEHLGASGHTSAQPQVQGEEYEQRERAQRELQQLRQIQNLMWDLHCVQAHSLPWDDQAAAANRPAQSTCSGTNRSVKRRRLPSEGCEAESQPLSGKVELDLNADPSM